MTNIIINSDLTKKIFSFLEIANSLKFLDSSIFETIDKYKENNDIDFNNYYLEYISGLPKLDFKTVVKISREIYKVYDKEQDFDNILEKLVSNYCISNGSLNPNDDNCITKAHESRVLLSGTYYDVVLLCHEIGHKLRYNNFTSNTDIMDDFFFETPSIILELAANDYLRNNYGVDIKTDQLRNDHVLSIKRNNSIDRNIFLTIIEILKKEKLNTVNLYNALTKNQEIMEYLCMQNHSIEECLAEVFLIYSYDIGYILGSHVNSSDNKVDLLNMYLKYKDNGINMPFTISESMIKSAFIPFRYTK